MNKVAQISILFEYLLIEWHRFLDLNPFSSYPDLANFADPTIDVWNSASESWVMNQTYLETISTLYILSSNKQK